MKRLVETLRVRTVGARAVVGLNGVPLLFDDTGAGAAARVPLNLWLQPGDNVIDIALSPVPTGDDAPPAPKLGPALEVTLLPADQAATPTLALNWDFPKDAPFEPVTFHLPTGTDTPAPSNLWTDARPFGALTDDDRAEILAEGMRLWQAFADRKLDVVMGLLDYRFDDFARAFGETAADMKEGAAQAYGALVNDAGWAPEPIDPDHVRLVPQGAYLVALEHRRQAFIASKVGSTKMVTLPVSLAKINGLWTVAR